MQARNNIARFQDVINRARAAQRGLESVQDEITTIQEKCGNILNQTSNIVCSKWTKIHSLIKLGGFKKRQGSQNMLQALNGDAQIQRMENEDLLNEEDF